MSLLKASVQLQNSGVVWESHSELSYPKSPAKMSQACLLSRFCSFRSDLQSASIRLPSEESDGLWKAESG